MTGALVAWRGRPNPRSRARRGGGREEGRNFDGFQPEIMKKHDRTALSDLSCRIGRIGYVFCTQESKENYLKKRLWKTMGSAQIMPNSRHTMTGSTLRTFQKRGSNKQVELMRGALRIFYY